MTRVLIWDLPTRLFHWLFAAGIVLAFVIAQFAGDDSALFPYHSMIGIVLGAMLVLRLIWGLVGTRYARFASFLFGPAAVAQYFRSIVMGKADRHIGHNPASSWAIYLMFAGLAVVVGSGLMMSRGNEAFEEIHEAAVYALLAVAVAHVVGVIVHTVRYRENITLGMITGRKLAEPSSAIRSAAPLVGAIFLGLLLFLAGGLLRNYDPATGQTQIPMLAHTIALREADERPGHHAPRNQRSEKWIEDRD